MAYKVWPYTGLATYQNRYVRVRYLDIGLATYCQSPKIAPSEGQA